MKKQNWQMAIIILVMSLLLCACGTTQENESSVPTATTEAVAEMTEPAVVLDPVWLADAAIDEAYACLFPLEGEKNVELAQEILFPLLEDGNAEAQYYWGYIYDWEIVDNNGEEEKESLYWHEQAIEQGFAKAFLAAALNGYVESEERANELVELAKQAGLFEMTPESLGADGCQMIGSYYYSIQDYNSALEWYTKATDMGCSVAPMVIGHLYYSGQGVAKDTSVAMDWYLEAANRGNVYAMNYYGYNYFTLNYINEIISQKYGSENKYQEDAKSGDPIAMHNLGQMYEHGLGGLKCNHETALNWYLKAAKLGDSHSMYHTGYMYHYGLGVNTNVKAAMDWYLKAADLGNADAMNQLAFMYLNGEGVASNDDKAQEWWQKASECEKTPENNDNRYLDYFSETTEGNTFALELLQKGADAGDANAMINIGYYGFETGYLGFDQGQARDWYKKAADEGNALAIVYLGYNYYKKCDDYDSAMAWLMKAYANGVDDVITDIEYMLSNKQGVNAYFENYGELISSKP